MRKITFNLRVTEIHRVGLYACQGAGKYNFTAADDISILTTLRELTDNLSEAVERERIKSDMEEANNARLRSFSALCFCVKLYTELTSDRIRQQCAEECMKTLRKYNMLSQQNNYTVTSLIDSLLNDLKEPDTAARLGRLGDAPEAVAQLTATQATFIEAEERWTHLTATRRESATSLARKLLRFMNRVFVPAFTVKAIINPALYAPYDAEMDAFIAQTNSMIRERRNAAGRQPKPTKARAEEQPALNLQIKEAVNNLSRMMKKR